MPFRKKENLIPERRTKSKTKARIMALVIRLLAQKMIKRKRIMARSLLLGSNLWIRESPGM
jgi:hypothetical protein